MVSRHASSDASGHIMMNNRTDLFSLAEILHIEDDADVVGRLCPSTGLPVWPQIRIAYLRAILSELVYGVELTGKSSTRAPRSRMLVTLMRSFAHNAFVRDARGPASICFFGDGIGNQWIDGKWFNRLSDHFIQVRPAETLAVEDHSEWNWPFPRHCRKVMFHAPIQALNTAASYMRVGRGERELARALVARVNERAWHILKWAPSPARNAALVEMLARKTAMMPVQLGAYRRLFQRIRPRLVMVNSGCYGPAAMLMAAAREQGITTAEAQHGAISGGHDAYNFAPAVLRSEAYRNTLPDYFLSYGNWWSEQINAPVTKLAIGNPHRSARISLINARPKTDLLVLSDGLDIERYLAVVRSIVPHAQEAGLRVVLRPHPLERTQAQALAQLPGQGFVLDQNADIYISFSSARVVVGEMSTGLFEAVGIADEICMWRTPRSVFSFPTHPFREFETVEELATILEQDQSELPRHVVPGEIWADQWQQRYNDFLLSKGVD